MSTATAHDATVRDPAETARQKRAAAVVHAAGELDKAKAGLDRAKAAAKRDKAAADAKLERAKAYVAEQAEVLAAAEADVADNDGGDS